MKLVLSFALCSLSHSLQFFDDTDSVVVIKNKKDLSSQVILDVKLKHVCLNIAQP